MTKIAELKKRLMNSPEFREEYEKAVGEHNGQHHPIVTIDDYNRALAEIAKYFDNQPEPGTPEGDRFDALAILIEAYEDKPIR